MKKYLIVDDDKDRAEKLKSTLETLLNKIIKNSEDKKDSHEIVIDHVTCTKEAIVYLKRTDYAIAFIDIALPVLESGEIDREGGINLLRKISSDTTIKKPTFIYGYTALEEDLKSISDKYKYEGFELRYSPSFDFSWLKDIEPKIKYYTNHYNGFREKKIDDIVIITLHGIRTYGDWQEKLNKLCQKNNKLKVEFLNYKYSLISTFSFFIPSKREKIVKHFQRELYEWLSQNRPKRIVCVGHSFGSYILMNAIKNISEESKSLLKEIDIVILCGTVLDRDYSFDFLNVNNSSIKIINECAVNDLAIAINEAFVPYLGLAGVTGFNGFSGSRLSNRFHAGGHSTFFKVEFMEKNWLPIIQSGQIEQINQASKQYFIYNKFILKLAMGMGRIKRFFCV